MDTQAKIGQKVKVKVKVGLDFYFIFCIKLAQGGEFLMV